jgi:hypothetical protein
MTSLENTLAGVGIGALLTWLSSWVQSRLQWTQEEKRRTIDRRTTLYLDMLIRMDEMFRGQQQYIRSGDQPMGDPRDDDEYEERHTSYDARVELFGSAKVNALWSAWRTLHSERWGLVFHGYDQGLEDRYEAAGTKLRRQMGAEINTS